MSDQQPTEPDRTPRPPRAPRGYRTRSRLDGLEDRWDARWTGRARTRFDRTAHAASRSTRSTPRRRRCPGRCTSATCSPTRTPTSSRATSACAGARSSTRWAGTTTACPPSAACRTTTACAATRRCRTTPDFTPPSRRAARARRQGRRPGAGLPPELHRAVRAPHGRGRAAVRGAVAPPRPVGRLGADLPDHRRRVPRGRAARVPAQPRPRRGVPGRGARACGT